MEVNYERSESEATATQMLLSMSWFFQPRRGRPRPGKLVFLTEEEGLNSSSECEGWLFQQKAVKRTQETLELAPAGVSPSCVPD